MSNKTVKATQVSLLPIGFFKILFLIFLTLKLTEHIDWSWWLVTAPLWGPWAVMFAIFLAIIGVCACFFVVCFAISFSLGLLTWWTSK